MEYVPGFSLSYYVREPWSWPKLWTLLDALLSGLAHAHARDLIHRDLKPGNVLAVPVENGSGVIKLADFGIALGVAEAASARRRIEGTPAYIAPEAASGDVAAIGPWTDLYSLGVMIFEILTGERPFHGRNLLTHHQRTPLPPIHVRRDVEAPAGLIELTKRLLAKAPYERFRSAAAVRAALRALGPAPEPEALGTPPTIVMLDDDPSTVEDGLVEPACGPSGPGLIHLREPPIAGRDADRDRLQKTAELVLNNGGPRVVLIEGDAGQGKSRLAGWLREKLEESGRMRTLFIRSEPQTRTGGGLRQGVLRFVGAPTLERADADRVLSSIFPKPETRENIIETLWFDTSSSSLGSEAHIVRADRMIRDLAGDLPLLVWADDAQWSPEGKILRLVHRLARRPQNQQILVVVTLRPSLRTTVKAARATLLKLPNVEVVQLESLNPAVLAPALEALAPLPQGLATAACVQAAGNPLLALEAVRSFLEREGVSSAPSDPSAVLSARIDSATSGTDGGEMRSTLARATLLGRSFTLQPLVSLCAVPGDPTAPAMPSEAEGVEALLERAVAAGLIVEQGPTRWRFSHDLVRGQLREICHALPNWPQLNLAAANLLSPRAEADSTGIELEVVARHHAEAGELSTALRIGLLGIKRLHASGLMGHATSFTRRILKWDDRCQLLSAQERGEMRIVCGDAAEHAGQPDEAERQCRAALEISERNYLPALASRAASRLGELRIHSNDADGAEEWLVRALRFARHSGDPGARCAAHLSLGQLYQHLGRYDSAIVAYQASLESARAGDCHAEALIARTAIAQIDRRAGRIENAEETLNRVIDDAVEHGLEVPALNARLQLALCAWARGDAKTAGPLFAEIAQSARGNLFAFEFFGCLGEAWAAAIDGDWGEVELLLMQAEELRYDVHLHYQEAEEISRALRTLADKADCGDVLGRLERLDSVIVHNPTEPRGWETTTRE